MADPVVHFEIIGRDPARLRSFYTQLFGWRTDTASPVAPEVSEEGEYGFIESDSSTDPVGIRGGIGGGADFTPHTVFYVGVADVAQTLAHAERLGGTMALPASANPGGTLTVAHFTDPEGNLIGLAGPTAGTADHAPKDHPGS